MTKILATDSLTIDWLLGVEEAPELKRLMQVCHLVMGGKATLTDPAMVQQFHQIFSTQPARLYPGGSSSNTLHVLSNLLQQRIKASFIGCVQSDAMGEMIVNGLDEAGITLHPRGQDFAARPRNPLSYIMTDNKGGRSIASCRGNAHQLLIPEMLKGEWFSGVDYFLLQGAAFHKFSEAYMFACLERVKRSGAKLWLTLPTGDNLTDAVHEEMVKLLPDAACVLANAEELAYFLRRSGALEARGYGVDENVSLFKRLFRLSPHCHLFVTDGSRGGYFLTGEEVGYVPAEKAAVSGTTLGAGDAAYGGYLSGVLAGLKVEKSAQLAMACAAQCLQEEGARLSAASWPLLRACIVP